jgi:hypothetical protein
MKLKPLYEEGLIEDDEKYDIGGNINGERE